uniref:RRM domain-containing protein n=1 Tax=Gouania willdenowi TaxID=441366 RepID=A0A8C5GZ58_GOUWI
MRRFAQTFVLAPEGTIGRRIVRYPDAHQLFVGNIPHDVEKTELMEFFEQFGSVLDFKIICRGKHPNFGFVVFNDSEPVQKILSSRPIELFDNVFYQKNPRFLPGSAHLNTVSEHFNEP